MEKGCPHCGERFTPHPSVPHQEYCNKAECQRARKHMWEVKKMKQDKDYRETKQESQKKWARNNPGYWREYRRTHPESAERNRIKQRGRNLRRRKGNGLIVKSDELFKPPVLVPGKYMLVAMNENGIAKSDELIVQISFVSKVKGSLLINSP